MTLSNARRRFEELGFEVDRDVHPYRYKFRRVGSLAWTRGNDLQAMLASVGIYA